MFSSVRIENFQSAKDITLTFKPGVNFITGPNQIGKSTTVRAIDELCNMSTTQNVETLIRDDTGGFRVTGTIRETGDKIILTRGTKDSRNGTTYQVIYADGREFYEDRCNGEVPPIVKDLLALVSERIGTDKFNLNVTTQDNPVKIIDASDGQKHDLLQRALGTVELKDAYNTSKALEKEIQNAKSSNHYTKIEKSRNIEAIKLGDIEDVQTDKDDINNALKKISALQTACTILNDIETIEEQLVDVNELQENLNEVEKQKDRFIIGFAKLHAISLLVEEIESLSTQLADPVVLTEDIHTVGALQQIAQKLVSLAGFHTSLADYSQKVNEMKLLKEELEEIKTVSASKVKLDTILKVKKLLLDLANLEQLTKDLKVVVAEIESLHAEKLKVLSDNKFCPTCERTIE